MKKFLTLFLCFLASVVIVVVLPMIFPYFSSASISDGKTEGLFHQEVTKVSETSHTIYKVYNEDVYVGVLSSKSKLDSFLKDVYTEHYKEDFPNSSVYLGKDVYVTNEQSYFSYTDCDEDIFNYLNENDLFSLKAYEVSFADGTDVFDRIYVSDEALYHSAMNKFLSFFISQESLNLLNNGKSTQPLTGYGRRDTGVSINQTITVDTGYAPSDQIYTTEEQVLEYLEYGKDTEKEYYTVEEFDTVEGVGAKNHGLTAQQIMNINADKISDVQQVLEKGDQLCVTYFNSPITINVTKEALREEQIYPDVQYHTDDSLLKGEQEVIQTGSNGVRNALYQETWTNGVLMKGTLLSSVTVQEPTDEIVNVGTFQQSDVGTGVFQWPTTNVAISCRWMCYANHQAIDIINVYNSYGEVLAADNGVIEENGYHYLSGNYVVINHNNGLYTYYAHMNSPSPKPVGTVVAKGEVIGQIGMSGNATGPHIHFYVGVGGPYKNTDPCSGYLDCSGY